jgi:hypothetical protein
MLAKLLLIPAACGLALLLLPAMLEPPRIPKQHDSPVEEGAQKLISAFREYAQEFQDLPTGTSGEMTQALTGENPSSHRFLLVPAKQLNARGELLDPWGTPYRLVVEHDQHEVRVQSAGANRVFEPPSKKSDDYYSWRKSQHASGGIPGLPF